MPSARNGRKKSALNKGMTYYTGPCFKPDRHPSAAVAWSAVALPPSDLGSYGKWATLKPERR